MDLQHLGPYRVLSTLGKGGMGTVYRGVHAKSDEQVAIKVIAESIARQERFRRRFDAEIETLKRLKHKHIVKLIGYGEEGDRLFYSMEFVDGESLHELIKENGRLHWRETVQFGIETCAALKHAHDFGVIHRDIKPANILIDKDRSVKVTDFGIAKLYGSTDETALGSVMGTADFMPPEQALGERVTVRSDLYSVGALLYACLSGRSPHAAKSLPEVLYNVRYKEPDSLINAGLDVPKELQILLFELLEKDSAKRPPTATVVLNRLSAMQAGLQKLAAQKQSKSNAKSEARSDNLDFDTDDLIVPSTKVKSKTEVAQQTRILHPADLKKADKKPHTAATDGTELTLASNDLIAASHRGRTTGVATHLTDFQDRDVASAGSESRFTIVGDEKQTSHKRHLELSDEDSSISTYLSIGFLSLAIVVCIGAIMFAMRKPSADKYYRDALAVTDIASPASVDEVATALGKFSTAYPNDPRLAEFSDVEQEIDLQRTVNALTRQLRRKGEASLTPIEVAFVEAMAIRERDPTAAIDMLQNLLIVFRNADSLNMQEKKLVDYASRELQRLEKKRDVVESPTELFLADQFDAAMKLSADEQAKFYRSVIELYDGKPMAKTAVARARAKLELP